MLWSIIRQLDSALHFMVKGMNEILRAVLFFPNRHLLAWIE